MDWISYQMRHGGGIGCTHDNPARWRIQPSTCNEGEGDYTMIIANYRKHHWHKHWFARGLLSCCLVRRGTRQSLVAMRELWPQQLEAGPFIAGMGDIRIAGQQIDASMSVLREPGVQECDAGEYTRTRKVSHASVASPAKRVMRVHILDHPHDPPFMPPNLVDENGHVRGTAPMRKRRVRGQ